jgi:hypothetical protein
MDGLRNRSVLRADGRKLRGRRLYKPDSDRVEACAPPVSHNQKRASSQGAEWRRMEGHEDSRGTRLPVVSGSRAFLPRPGLRMPTWHCCSIQPSEVDLRLSCGHFTIHGPLAFPQHFDPLPRVRVVISEVEHKSRQSTITQNHNTRSDRQQCH